MKRCRRLALAATLCDPDAAAAHILALLDGTGVRAVLWPDNPRTTTLRRNNASTIQQALGMTVAAARQFAAHFDRGAYESDSAAPPGRS